METRGADRISTIATGNSGRFHENRTAGFELPNLGSNLRTGQGPLSSRCRADEIGVFEEKILFELLQSEWK